MTVSLAPRVAVKRPAEELRALAEQGNVELGSLTDHEASAAEVITWVARNFSMPSAAVACSMADAALPHLVAKHLPGVDVPLLFLQGRNDPFAIPNEQLDELVARLGPIATLEWIEDANHSFEVKGRKRSAAEIGASLAPRAQAFMAAHPVA